MRRGDAQVAATLMAMKLPVCQMRRVGSRASRTIRRRKRRSARSSSRSVCSKISTSTGCLENLLAGAGFRSGCHEDIWTITNGQVRLEKTAARMPSMLEYLVVDQKEDLVALVQHGFHGGSFTSFAPPADKIALIRSGRRAANSAGRRYSPRRTPALVHKGGAVQDRRDRVRAERDGRAHGRAGGGGDEGRSGNLREVPAFRGSAPEQVYLMMPAGYKFDLKGVVGQVRDCKDSIAHHNMQISMAGLAQFMIMGQSSRGGGNRSLGETMSDFFYLALQTVANQVGDAVSDNTIARLAAYNFGPNGGRRGWLPSG